MPAERPDHDQKPAAEGQPAGDRTRIHQGEATYASRDYSPAAQRSKSHLTQQAGFQADPPEAETGDAAAAARDEPPSD